MDEQKNGSMVEEARKKEEGEGERTVKVLPTRISQQAVRKIGS